MSVIFLEKIFRAWRLAGLLPVSRTFGFDRGMPVDRYYIEKFLAFYREDIRGQVLEIGAPEYTNKFGGTNVVRSDVLHAEAGNIQATLVGNLATGEGIPDHSYDCMILTQTFPFIYDVNGAITHSYSKLRDGGVLLATFPGISQISRYDMDRWGDYWRFTDASVSRLIGDVFGAENVKVETWGNVLIACSFLHGLASHELTRRELDYTDPDYQLLVTVRAVKQPENLA